MSEESKKKKGKKPKQNQPEVYKLEDGSQVNKFCLNRLSDLTANVETIWDILNTVTKLAKLKITRSPNGFVTDVVLSFPQANEVIAQMALKNFYDFHELRIAENLDPQDVLTERREKLENMIRLKSGSK